MLEAQVQLGLTYYSMGRAADAVTLWSEALRSQPGRQDAQMYLRMVAGETSLLAARSDAATDNADHRS